MRRWFLERLAYWATRLGMRTAVWAVKAFPRPVIFLASDGIAKLAFCFFRSFRLRSRRNLSLAFGDRLPEVEVCKIAQNSLRNFFRAFAEIPMILASDTAELRGMVSVTGFEHLDAALAKGNGVILLSRLQGDSLDIDAELSEV